MFIRDNEIIVPENGESKGLILIISPNLVTGENIKQQLLEITYSVVGPFNSVRLFIAIMCNA